MLSQKNMGIYKTTMGCKCAQRFFDSSYREGSASEHATMPELVNTKSKGL